MACAWPTVFFTSATATPLEMPSWRLPTPGATRATTAVALAVPFENGVVSPSALGASPTVATSTPTDAVATSAVRAYPAAARRSVPRISTPPVRFASGLK